uniref:L-type lectin-domain containing receptor kinase V.8 isoform X1 n=1 Tax=Elaeis guineensis var. tenera TaxID=51953 RepID=A0A8N4I9B3_ELAGV|nr:putative L-type lectin-domain containing receptor kinase V.8 isoform X1 [Elaeis guineensis]XP_029121434.1 putative L-type lectin-domain containing receptor kinase V.8 isoform X1 [Elaeis guineensis]XP_029121435.1 putative L-type lectin-domain containing receptor kinase V.8 isoform X1 [Elaeis guineensis]XP_029121436.1 putative L-type lectin-domain containing receptor kinase V.8 isoform X1 [Elaeis guineensis]
MDEIKSEKWSCASTEIRMNEIKHEKWSCALAFTKRELGGVPGTRGYIAPECFHTCHATRESDIFAFGAVILETVCGHHPFCNVAGFQLLVYWVWKLYQESHLPGAVDPRLTHVGDCMVTDVKRLLLLGLACSHVVVGDGAMGPYDGVDVAAELGLDVWMEDQLRHRPFGQQRRGVRATEDHLLPNKVIPAQGDHVVMVELLGTFQREQHVHRVRIARLASSGLLVLLCDATNQLPSTWRNW